MREASRTSKTKHNPRHTSANQQNGMQALTVARPTNNDKKIWKEYWEQQGQSWRTEPEIDTERQRYLDEQ
jgi:hypothetical protein